jgi:hypothetical protein
MYGQIAGQYSAVHHGTNPRQTTQGYSFRLKTTNIDIEICWDWEKNFTFMWPCVVTDFLIMKPTRCIISQIYFGNETLHVSDSSSVRHQELFTVHSAMVYVIQVRRQLSSSRTSCLQTCMTYTIAVCTVNNSWWWTEELSETCRVSFPK